MIPKITLSAALAASLFAAGLAQAQSHPPSDERVAEITQRARALLPIARLEDGSNVPPETATELAEPIILRSTEIATIRRGELSGQMQHCGLDWENQSFLPYMRHLRAGGWRGKRMAYVGMLHGTSQAMTLRALRERRGVCGADAIAAMTAEAATLGKLP